MANGFPPILDLNDITQVWEEWEKGLITVTTPEKKDSGGGWTPFNLGESIVSSVDDFFKNPPNIQDLNPLNPMQDAIDDMSKEVGDSIDNFTAGIGSWFDSVTAGIGSWWDASMSGVGSWWDGLWSGVGSWWDASMSGVGSWWDSGIGGVSKWFEKYKWVILMVVLALLATTGAGLGFGLKKR